MQERGAGPALNRRRQRVGAAPLALMLGVAGLTTAVDQLTKWWALEALDDRIIDLVWTLRLRLAFNKGSAFGLGAGLGPVIGLLALTIVVVLVWTSRRTASTTGAVAVGLVLGGAVGNLADRALREGEGFLRGGVVDFIDLQWWPVFNLADVAIVIGAVVLAVWTTGERS